MPHLVIEYTANLVNLDPAHVLEAAVTALGELGEYDLPTTKARTRRYEDFTVGHPHSGAAYIAITLAILPGRSPEILQRTSRALTEAVARAVPAVAGTQITTEIREMNSYTKIVL